MGTTSAAYVVIGIVIIVSTAIATVTHETTVPTLMHSCHAWNGCRCPQSRTECHRCPHRMAIVATVSYGTGDTHSTTVTLV